MRAWPSLAHAAILATMLVRLAWGGAQLRDSDPGGKLPISSVVLLESSRMVAEYWWLVASLVLALAIGNGVMLHRLGGMKTVSGWRWAWRVGGVLFGLWMLMEFAILFTLRGMIERMPTS